MHGRSERRDGARPAAPRPPPPTPPAAAPAGSWTINCSCACSSDARDWAYDFRVYASGPCHPVHPALHALSVQLELRSIRRLRLRRAAAGRHRAGPRGRPARRGGAWREAPRGAPAAAIRTGGEGRRRAGRSRQNRPGPGWRRPGERRDGGGGKDEGPGQLRVRCGGGGGHDEGRAGPSGCLRSARARVSPAPAVPGPAAPLRAKYCAKTINMRNTGCSA